MCLNFGFNFVSPARVYRELFFFRKTLPEGGMLLQEMRHSQTDIQPSFAAAVTVANEVGDFYAEDLADRHDGRELRVVDAVFNPRQVGLVDADAAAFQSLRHGLLGHRALTSRADSRSDKILLAGSLRASLHGSVSIEDQQARVMEEAWQNGSMLRFWHP
jgi:hypothetical protein